MNKYIYEVCLKRGRSNPNHATFFENVGELNAKAPDFGGINNMCLIGHHHDADTIRMLCSSGIKKKSDVTVEEITKETLSNKSSHHRVHTEIIKSYFLPYGTYLNIK